MDTVKRLYEGMFLVDSALATADWNGVTAELERVLSRAEAEVVTMKKWDERRLAYDVEGKSRATYILTYFNTLPEKIGGIERDVQLSEKIMRVLILRTDRQSEADMNRETPAQTAEREGDSDTDSGDRETAYLGPRRSRRYNDDSND